MSKYSEQDKLRAINYYLAGHSFRETERALGINWSSIKEWVRMYRKNGVEGITKKNRNYTGDFKMHVVEYMHTHQISSLEAASLFLIPSHRVVDKWERVYYEEGVQGLYRENRGKGSGMKSNDSKKKILDKQTEKDLIAEVQKLRMENEYLKKLNALIREREKSERPTK